MHTNHSFRCSLGKHTENTANPAEANFSINLGKRAWEMICSSFPSLANELLGWGVNIHHAFLFGWGIPATHVTQHQKKKN